MSVTARVRREATVGHVRRTIALDEDTERRLERFARRRHINKRSEAIRSAIREAKRRVDIERILTRTGRFELRHSNEGLEAVEVRHDTTGRPR